MTERNSSGGGFGRGVHARSPLSGAGQSRLAHWPPPFRGREVKPVLVKHAQEEPAKRAKPRGWRLKRSLFSEFSDD